MKTRYITLITQRGEPQDHPRGHLRWLELDETGLKFGFSSASVVAKGKNLGLLMRDVVTAKTEVIQARPERAVEPGQWAVHEIGPPPPKAEVKK